MIEKGHEADETISDISSTEFYKIISRFWCAGMWISLFLYIWKPLPKYTASRPRIQTQWHYKCVISPYLTKCASRLILIDSGTLVPFHAPQLRPLFGGRYHFGYYSGMTTNWPTSDSWFTSCCCTRNGPRQHVYVCRTWIFVYQNYCLEESWLMFMTKQMRRIIKKKTIRLELCI
jgi:hypothetical protein